MKIRSRLGTALLVIAALTLLPGMGEAAGRYRTPERPPRLDSRLARVALVPPADAVAEARARGLTVNGDSVLVEVFAAFDAAATTRAVEDLGGAIVSGAGSRLLVAIAPDALLELAADSSVAFVAVPAEPVAEGTVNEAVSGEGVAAWQDAGFDGSGVDVLVVDSGFVGLQAAQASGDLPGSFGGTRVGPTCGAGSLAGPDPDDVHGTAVTEVVHDMAPGATLHLYRTCLLWDGPDIARYVKTHDIDVVSQSLAYFNTVPLDGRDPWEVFSHIDEVVGQGVLWFNSAGNYRERHWRGTWSGTDTLDFGGMTTIQMPLTAGAPVYVRWDDWRLNLGSQCGQCATDIDLDLYLLDGNGIVAASSTTPQSSADPGPPVEALRAPFSGNFFIEVRNASGQSIPSTLAIDLFVPRNDLPSGLRVPAGSLNDASTMDSVISVGAVCWVDGGIRPYSSEGPTSGGRLKPDVSAFDGVSTSTYGPSSSCNTGFLGTSSATPNAAGAAAIVMGATGARGAEAWGLLTGLTVDQGPPGPDNRYGVGTLVLGEAPSGQCHGVAATIIALAGQLTIEGTEGPDVIVANSRPNVVRVGSGDDRICALGGADLVYGQGGADSIWGGTGADVLLGGPDDDTIRGSGGRDELRGSQGDDILFGGRGDDVLVGGKGPDTLNGGRGTDDCRTGSVVTHCEA